MLIKILLLSHSFYPSVGGIETVSELLAQDFASAGYEVRLLTWSLDTSGKTYPFSVLRNPTIKEIFYLHRWSDLVFENNPCLQLTWPGIFFGRPSIIALHTWLSRVDGEVGWQDKLKKWWLGRATTVIACSEAIRKCCWPAAIVIANAYQNDLFVITNNKRRTGKFVFLGRLVSDKGADLAIQAIGLILNLFRLDNRITDIQLTIIGEGPERNMLENLVDDLNLISHITFTGILQGEQLVDCLNQHQYMLVPSRWEEPFGIVALEGMACGCIPIVSDSGGLPEAVGEAGLVFKCNDVDSLLETMLQVYDNIELEEQLRRAAPAHLLAHQQHVVTRRYLDVVENSLLELGKFS